MIQRSAGWYLLYFACCAGIVIGGALADSYPPFDPFIWVMLYCVGGIVGLLYPEEFKE